MIKRTLLCTVLALAAPALHAVELSFIRGPLEKSATADPKVSGTVRTQFKKNFARMYATLKGLTAGAAYQLTVDGVVEADFVGSSSGKTIVHFRVSPTGTQHALDFDPRGKEIAVTDGTNVLLSMIYSGEGEPTALIVDERTSLVRGEAVATGRVEARYLDQKNKSRFILHLLGLDRGIYTVRVAGVDSATVDLSKGRSALVVFEANKFGPLKAPANGKVRKNRHGLTFDPRGELVEVVAADGSVAFSGVMQAKIDVLPVDDDGGEIPLTSTGEDPDATGNAVVTTDEAGETTLTITVQQLPVGGYEVWIGGAVRGTVNVTDDGTGATQGQIVFATLTTGTETPLDFPVAGAIEIKQAETVFLTGSLD